MRLQKKITFAATAFMVMWWCASARAQQKPPIAIIISGPRTIVVGDNLTVGITTKNVTDQALNLYGIPDLVEQYFKVAIHDENGGVPPITDFGKQAKTIYVVSGSHSLCYFPAGATAVNSMDISKQYDLSKPGRYTVQLTRSVSGVSPESTVVKSNELTITVVPKKADASQ